LLVALKIARLKRQHSTGGGSMCVRYKMSRKGWGQMPVAHACNPSYSGGRDQEDCSLKPAQENSL
jgi:hypothetical protein